MASSEVMINPNFRVSVLLSFIAGYIDTIGFVAFAGLFMAHVTGNFVLIGASIVSQHGGLIAKLLALPTFIAAIGLTMLIVHFCERRQRSAISPLLLAQAFFLLLLMVLGLMLPDRSHPDSLLSIVTGMMGVIAMGIQNASGRLVFNDLAPSTVMTGNVTQVVIDSINFVRHRGNNSAEEKRIRKMLPAVLAFALGAISGALFYHLLGFSAVALAIGLLAIVWWNRAFSTSE
ncbi:YoaK family protein [Aquirhabdus sp.]|uniref:YoaK family protein n=1 Tax=Aquirhabdus sp. TaxID=2824160 RepID=UPI00396CE4E4